MSSAIHMPAEEYHASPALGSNAVKCLATQSAAHFKARYIDGIGREETEALIFGQMLHECVLEPEKWARRVVAPDVDRRTKDGKAAYADFMARVAAESLTVTGAAHKAQAEAMRESLLAHPFAGHLIRNAEVTEASYFWEEDGVPCKARIDAGIKRAIIVDLKTTEDASPDGFARSVQRYGYHIQDAHYSAGYEMKTGTRPEFVFIAIEKSAPYVVQHYTLDPAAKEIGALLRKRALRTYRECKASGVWPGYAERAQVISLPRWYANEFREEVA